MVNATISVSRGPLTAWGAHLIVGFLFLFAFPQSALQARDSSQNSGSVPEGETVSTHVHLQVTEANDIRFSRLSTADGLSQTRATSIVQDKHGFMWFGTGYGLNRYDGYSYKVFLHDPARNDSLGCVYIRALFVDRAGTLWVGCDRSVERYDASTETFRHYPLGNSKANSSPAFVFSINEDRQGTLWVSTAADGLYRLNPQTGEIARFGHDPANPWSLSSNDVNITGEDRESRFWVSDGGNIEEFDRSSGRVIQRVRVGSSAPRAVLFYEDHFGTFWIMYVLQGQDSGLAVLDRNANRLRRYTIDDSESGKPLTSGIYAAAEDQDNTLWFATWGDGLLRYDRQRGILVRYRNHPGDLESIADDRVTSIYADHGGNVWVGLQAMTPNFFRTSKPTFVPLLRGPSGPNSMGEAFMNAVYEDREGAVWASTTGALVKLDLKGGKNTFYRPPGSGLTHDVIAINEDRSGELWVGTVGAGLNQFDRATGKFKTYLNDPRDPTSLSNNVASRILIDRNGNFWVTTWDGLNKFDRVHNRFTVYKPSPAIGKERFWDITEDRNGILWLGGTAGLNRFDPATSQFTIYGHNLADPQSVSDNTVTSVLEDHSGRMWVTTENGFNEFDRSTGKFVSYYKKDGLPSSALSCVLEDNVGKLWIGTSNGISKFDPRTRHFQNYSTADGIPGGDFMGWETCFKSRDGEMFFAGFSGGIAFYPDRLDSRADPAPIVLTDFQLSGNSVEVEPRSPLKRSIGYTKEITLRSDQDFFSLTFAALTYFNPGANRYRYKLDGLKQDWIEVGSDRRTATFIALPPGKYTFRVQFQTKTGLWADPGIALPVTILPPWWATLWFRAACVIAFMAMLWGLYRLRVRQMAHEFNTGLEARVEERARIARDLHDTLLQSFQGLLLRFQTAANLLPARPLDAQQKLESAIELTAQAITEGRDAVQGLRQTTLVNDLAMTLNALGQELGADHAGRSSVGFCVELEGTPRNLHPILRDEVYRIGAEALRNAFRHAQARQIELEIRYDNRLLRLRVRDDGKGIDPKVLAEGGREGHFGLNGMRERAKMIGGKLDVWSERTSGTEVELSIPASKAYTAPSSADRSGASEKVSGKGTVVES